jgi:glutamate carboxypeptidase
MSVNPARIDGGAANNVVPDHAVLRFNIRPKTSQAADAFDRDLNALLRSIETEHEVRIAPHGGITRPPKPVPPHAQTLFDLVADTSEALGRKLGWQASGGVCDGNNIAACGVPVVDTMGVRGGAIHSPDEYLIASSLSERAALSAVVLHRLATGDAL